MLSATFLFTFIGGMSTLPVGVRINTVVRELAELLVFLFMKGIIVPLFITNLEDTDKTIIWFKKSTKT